MDFAAIADLRLFLREIIDRHSTSLRQYYDAPTGGFYHRHDEPQLGKFSKSSTATCVLSLRATGHWDSGPWNDTGATLLTNLLTIGWARAKGAPDDGPELPPGSAGLQPGNPFTGAWLLDAVNELSKLYPLAAKDESNAERISRAEALLVDAVASGGAKIQGYPESAYVTQLVVRILQKRGLLQARKGTGQQDPRLVRARDVSAARIAHRGP